MLKWGRWSCRCPASSLGPTPATAPLPNTSSWASPPKALLLFCQNGRTSYCVSYGMAYGGLALEGHPVIIQNREVLTLNSSGFTVRKEFQEKAVSPYSNADGVFYHYIAFA